MVAADCLMFEMERNNRWERPWKLLLVGDGGGVGMAGLAERSSAC